MFQILMLSLPAVTWLGPALNIDQKCLMHFEKQFWENQMPLYVKFVRVSKSVCVCVCVCVVCVMCVCVCAKAISITVNMTHYGKDVKDFEVQCYTQFRLN